MRVIYLLAAVIFLSCCNTKPSATLTQTGTTSVSEPIPFAGFWVSQAYYESLMRHKSPMEAQNGSSSMAIPDSTLKPFGMVFNFHEGISDLIVVKNNGGYQINLISKDTLINYGAIEIPAPGKMKFGKETYIKVNIPSGVNNQQILEELLFKGIYTNNNGETWEFKNDGTLTGFPDYRSYTPTLDYLDAGLQVDQVSFEKTNSKTSRLFAFKFKGDTLELYNLKCLQREGRDCAEVDFGELQFRLWRKNLL